MTPSALQKCRNLIMKHEKFRGLVYTDNTGDLKIGYGHNLQTKAISYHIGTMILDEDMYWFIQKLYEVLDFFPDLSDARKCVLIDMAMDLGLQGLLEFKEMIDFMRAKDYENAANEILNSKWAHKDIDRAKENADIVRTDLI